MPAISETRGSPCRGGFAIERVKIFLKDARAGLYYAGAATWSAEVADAMGFDSIDSAAAQAVEEKMEAVNVVLRYDKPTCELALPLAACVPVPEDAAAYIKHRRSPP